MSQRNAGYAFIEFSSGEVAARVLQDYNGQPIAGVCSWALLAAIPVEISTCPAHFVAGSPFGRVEISLFALFEQTPATLRRDIDSIGLSMASPSDGTCSISCTRPLIRNWCRSHFFRPPDAPLHSIFAGDLAPEVTDAVLEVSLDFRKGNRLIIV